MSKQVWKCFAILPIANNPDGKNPRDNLYFDMKRPVVAMDNGRDTSKDVEYYAVKLENVTTFLSLVSKHGCIAEDIPMSGPEELPEEKGAKKSWQRRKRKWM